MGWILPDPTTELNIETMDETGTSLGFNLVLDTIEQVMQHDFALYPHPMTSEP